MMASLLQLDADADSCWASLCPLQWIAQRTTDQQSHQPTMRPSCCTVSYAQILHESPALKMSAQRLYICSTRLQPPSKQPYIQMAHK